MCWTSTVQETRFNVHSEAIITFPVAFTFPPKAFSQILQGSAWAQTSYAYGDITESNCYGNTFQPINTGSGYLTILHVFLGF